MSAKEILHNRQVNQSVVRNLSPHCDKNLQFGAERSPDIYRQWRSEYIQHDISCIFRSPLK